MKNFRGTGPSKKQPIIAFIRFTGEDLSKFIKIKCPGLSKVLAHPVRDGGYFTIQRSW